MVSTFFCYKGNWMVDPPSHSASAVGDTNKEYLEYLLLMHIGTLNCLIELQICYIYIQSNKKGLHSVF